jgi:hypothetical protein
MSAFPKAPTACMVLLHFKVRYNRVRGKYLCASHSYRAPPYEVLLWTTIRDNTRESWIAIVASREA